MTYPYIGKSTRNETVVLFSSEGLGIQLNHENAKYSEAWLEDNFENITADYLRGAYGKVGSKKHAEFIVELAKGAGIALDNKFDLSIYNCYFVFRKTEDNIIRLGFYSRCAAASGAKKLITLPLPPKEENMGNLDLIPNKLDSKHENWDNYYVSKGSWLWQRMEQLNSRTGCMSYDTPEKGIIIDIWNQLNTDSESEEGKEWPQTGDEVLIDCSEHLSSFENFNGQICEVISVCEHQNTKILTLSHRSLGVKALIMGKWIKKPPTPEEELADILTEITGYQNRQAVLSGARAIINGEIKGLSYKPD